MILFALQKSKDSKKGPVVILSITYRGVKFIDAASKVTTSNVRGASHSFVPFIESSTSPLLDHSSRARDPEHLLCRPGPGRPVHVRLHHQGPEERPPFLSCLQHGRGGKSWQTLNFFKIPLPKTVSR